MPFDFQPVLRGALLELRPLRADDYGPLAAAAADPLIWEQRPASDRHRDEVFGAFFDEHLSSGGALVAIDAATGEVVGTSRFHGYDAARSEVEIGWTFLVRSRWGGTCNRELKRLMLGHAFRYVQSVVFLVHPDNLRSRRAVEKLGAVEAGSRPDGAGRESVVYRIDASALDDLGSEHPLLRRGVDPRFHAAIDRQDLSLDVAVDDEALAALRSAVPACGAVLLGEVHGVAENVAAARWLMRMLGIRRLALEWEPALRPLVERFLATGRLSVDLHEREAAHVETWLRRGEIRAPSDRVREAIALCSTDGRVTAGHFVLLRALHAEENLDQLVLFAAGARDWSARDRAMAETLLEGWDRQGALLAVAGNLHTRLEPHRHGVPLGAHVAAAAPRCVEIVLEYGRGRRYDDGRAGTFTPRPFAARRPRLKQLAARRLRLRIPRAHPAVVARLAPTSR